MEQSGKYLMANQSTPNRYSGVCRHSLVDLSAPSILPIRVQGPSTPSTLFSIYNVQIVYLSFELELECEKNKNKQKEAEIGPFFKKTSNE